MVISTNGQSLEDYNKKLIEIVNAWLLADKRIDTNLYSFEDIMRSFQDYQYIILAHLIGITSDNLYVNVNFNNNAEVSSKIYSDLQRAIKKLITQSHKNYLAESELLIEKDGIISGLKQDLKKLKKINVELSGDNSKLNNKYRDLHDKEKEYLDKISDLNNTILDLETTVAEDENKVLTRQRQEIELLKTQIRELKIQLNESKKELDTYRELEKDLIPELRQNVFRRKHMGKSISLEPSQIDKIMRCYLNGDSCYKISKDLKVAYTTVRKIIECDYSTSASLKKILSVLKSVNGNWGNEKKQELLSLINRYEDAYRNAVEIDEDNVVMISDKIKNIGDYLDFCNM